MKKINRNRGFTLIELLVVIAIIGILSSVVLVSLNSARSKGTNARIEQETNQIRTALETEFDGARYPSLVTGGVVGGTGNLGDTSSNANIKTLALDLNKLNGKTGVASVAIFATSTFNAYAIQVASVAGVGFVCVDSSGIASSSYSGTNAFNADCSK